ncbi:GNAT family N-acetyltransferase, partial [Accumulibacter sp.]|uniref:GNAT family N-acetyltransferase n=1 Tax=Accumulibacter sp. TaxID=2053492 RepID=UPI0025FF52E1
MATVIERYGALESTGWWEADRGTAIHPDNAQGKFYRRLLECAATRGEAVVFEYLFDDRVVASNLCLRRDEVLVILKTTYDESIQSYSPAFLLSQDTIELLCHEGRVQRIEYYGRMMEWHSRWTETSRVLYHLTIYRWPLLLQLAAWRRRRSPLPTTEQRGSASLPERQWETGNGKRETKDRPWPVVSSLRLTDSNGRGAGIRTRDPLHPMQVR